MPIMKTTKPPLPIWGHSVGETNSEAEVHPHGNRDLIEFGRTHQGIAIAGIPNPIGYSYLQQPDKLSKFTYLS